MCEGFGSWNPSLRVGDLYLYMGRAGQETEPKEGAIRADRSIGWLGGFGPEDLVPTDMIAFGLRDVRNGEQKREFYVPNVVAEIRSSRCGRKV